MRLNVKGEHGLAHSRRGGTKEENAGKHSIFWSIKIENVWEYEPRTV